MKIGKLPVQLKPVRGLQEPRRPSPGPNTPAKVVS